MEAYTLTKASLVSPDQVTKSGSLAVGGKMLRASPQAKSADIEIGDSFFVYPALINIHDHLRGNYLPRVGPHGDNYYVNWAYWDNDLKTSDLYTERSNLSDEQLYFLSAYKNLFSGCVTVNDHFPHEMNAQYLPKLPIRAIREYSLAHECSSFDLKWGKGIEVEFKEATKKDWPFITHLEEGFDPESQSGIDILKKLKCLDDHTVLIHCLGFSEIDIKDVHKAGAHIAWCPASNVFMFNTTCKIKKILAAGINVSLGTDSSATGSVNLFAEMRFAEETFKRLYGEDLPPATIMRMVTTNPAKAFRMQDMIGSLDAGKLADFMVLKAKHADPYENLVKADMADIELLVMEGKAIYGEERFSDLKDASMGSYSAVQVDGRHMFVRGDPAALLADVRKAVGFEKKLDFLPIGTSGN